MKIVNKGQFGVEVTLETKDTMFHILCGILAESPEDAELIIGLLKSIPDVEHFIHISEGNFDMNVRADEEWGKNVLVVTLVPIEEDKPKEPYVISFNRIKDIIATALYLPEGVVYKWNDKYYLVLGEELVDRQRERLLEFGACELSVSRKIIEQNGTKICLVSDLRNI